VFARGIYAEESVRDPGKEPYRALLPGKQRGGKSSDRPGIALLLLGRGRARSQRKVYDFAGKKRGKKFQVDQRTASSPRSDEILKLGGGNWW